MTGNAIPIAFEYVDLAGDTPPELGLPALPSVSLGIDALRRAFKALSPPSFQSPCVVIYAAGHAWLGKNGSALTCLRLNDGSNTVLTGPELFGELERRAAGRHAIVFLDTCHARAFEPALRQLIWKPWAVIFASGQDQSASAFAIDKSTRLMSTLIRYLTTKKQDIDLDDVLARVSKELGAADVIAPQSVEVFRFGPRLCLKRHDRIGISRTGVTVSTIRGALFGIGAILAVSMIGAGWFYVSHAWIEVDLRDLSRHARHVELTVTEEEPRENASVVVLHEPAQGRVLRLRVPASDIVLHVLASYPDQQERRLNFPMLLSPGIAWSDKFGKLTLPGADEVLAHPLMAYVPAERWVETPGTPPNVSKHPFWIDIYPVTVFEYEPILRSLLQQSKLSSDQSVLAKLVTPENLHQVGADQVGRLADNLAPILNMVNAAAREHPVEQVLVAPQLALMPCDNCAAPVSYEEAVLYCGMRHARLPRLEELELAGRGIDGRRYPWGDRYDASRANAPGLPQKGDPPPAMKPVYAYPNGSSPFGVMDIVGDAGKWVARDDNSYPIYIGASFRQSGDEVQPFAAIPYVEGTSVPEISARCVEY